jgi:DNA-binding transcriptional LysR family regulator
MDIAALQAFVAVADSGSFSRAAEAVFLTQPAISKRIAALESELGTPLFDRLGRRIQLSPAGTALLDQARRILSEVAEAKRRIANLSGSLAGPLSLGTSYHVGLHRLQPALKAFYQRHPEVQLDLRFMDSEAACHAVQAGQLELAVITLPIAPDTSLRSETVWDDALEIVVSRDHALARKKKNTLQALTDYPAILPVAGTYTREIILAALGPVRERLHIGMETNYLEVIKMLVSIGLGWSVLPLTLIDAELKVVQIKGVRIKRSLGIVTHASRTLSNAAQAMIATVKQSA